VEQGAEAYRCARCAACASNAFYELAAAATNEDRRGDGMAVLDDALTDLRQTVATLKRELDQRTAERDEALAQQAATAEVLRVINSSSGDLTPVFEAIVASAARVCEAEFSVVARLEDGLLHF
jgi:hypothetical protein